MTIIPYYDYLLSHLIFFCKLVNISHKSSVRKSNIVVLQIFNLAVLHFHCSVKGKYVLLKLERSCGVSSTTFYRYDVFQCI